MVTQADKLTLAFQDAGLPLTDVDRAALAALMIRTKRRRTRPLRCYLQMLDAKWDKWLRSTHEADLYK
jgi:hypothetical protein